MTTSSDHSTLFLELVQSLNTLYGGNSSSNTSSNHSQNANRFKRANEFLMKFRKHPQAYNICLSILTQFETNQNNSLITLQMMRFSSATFYDSLIPLTNALNSNKSQLQMILCQLQKFIQTFTNKYLLSYLDNQSTGNNIDHQSFRFILNKICHSICFLVINNNDCISFLSQIFKQLNNIQLPQQMSHLWCNLEILNAFALEYKKKMKTVINNNDVQSSLLSILLQSLICAKEHQMIKLMQISFSVLRQWIRVLFSLSFLSLF